MSHHRTFPTRTAAQIAAAVLALFLLVNALMFLFYTNDHDRKVGFSIIVIMAPLFIASLFVATRARKPTASADNVPCPASGYNLRGLKETRCPECGAEYTIDQLVSQSDSL